MEDELIVLLVRRCLGEKKVVGEFNSAPPGENGGGDVVMEGGGDIGGSSSTPYCFRAPSYSF